jgi:hypothetical protein
VICAIRTLICAIRTLTLSELRAGYPVAFPNHQVQVARRVYSTLCMESQGASEIAEFQLFEMLAYAGLRVGGCRKASGDIFRLFHP